MLADLISSEKEGDRLYWRLVQEARKVLSLSEKEITDYAVEEGGGVIRFGMVQGWDSQDEAVRGPALAGRVKIFQDVSKKQDYTLPDRLVIMLIDKLNTMDKEKKLSMNLASMLDVLETKVD